MAGKDEQRPTEEPQASDGDTPAANAEPATDDAAAAADVEVEVEVEVDADAPADEQPADEPPPRPKPIPDPREARIQTLERLLGEREATLHTYIKAHKKAEGEFEAFKARARRDLDREIVAAKGKVVERMLDVDENLERTIQAVEQGGTVDSLIEGVRLVHRMFVERMAELGLERIDPIGQTFDPTSMEALGIVPVADPKQDNTVMMTMRAGFRMGEHEIRPALVQVGRKM